MELVAQIEREWLGSKDFEKHQAGFCSQWLLDNSCKYCANLSVSINPLSPNIHIQIPQADLKEILRVGVWIILFYEATPFEDKVSTILSLIVHQQAKQYLNNLKCNNCMMLSYCGFHCFTPPHNIVIRIMFHYFLQKWSCLSWRILLCSNMDVTTIFFILSGCLENQP